MFYYFKIENGILNENFNEKIFSYNVAIENDVTKLEFDFKMYEGYTINIVGNENLNEGDNYIFLEITHDNKTTTYTFKAIKEKSETVFSYNEPVMLEIPKKENNINYIPIVFVPCLIIILILFKIIFKKKKQPK